jgi:hypothetical protein
MLRALLALLGCLLGCLLIIPIVVIGVPFWVVALLTRTLRPWLSPRVVQWTELIQFDPMIGWKPKSDISAVCEALQADVFYVETDREGWRGPASLDDSDLIVFGDSYAFGYAVNRPFFHASRTGLRM